MRLEAENGAHRSKNTRLETELANFQMELLEKDELLQTSVRLADFERVKTEQEASNAAFKSLEHKMNQTLSELDEAGVKLSNEKSNYLNNIHVRLQLNEKILTFYSKDNESQLQSRNRSLSNGA